MALLEVEQLTRRFGGVVALDGVTLEVEARAVVGLIGPNGAGKTTVFNLVAGLYRPDAGDVRLDGETLLRLAPHEVARRGVARTFQNVELFRTMTVLENVLVGAQLRAGRPREASARRRALEVLDHVGLAEVAARPARSLPYATLKRVELARALATEPRLLLLDEPAGGLGHEEVDELAAFLRRLRDELGLAILLVEHHMGLVTRVCETVHVLDFGRRIASGTPQQVQSDPRVIEAYLGVEAGGAAA